MLKTQLDLKVAQVVRYCTRSSMMFLLHSLGPIFALLNPSKFVLPVE